MGKSSIEFKGFVNIQEKLLKNATMSDVKEIVKMNTAELQKGMQRNASFNGHYEYQKGEKVFVKPTGTTKRSITLDIKSGGLKGLVYPTTNYASYLEYGTRFMSAQPFIKPAFFVQKYKFVKDLSRLMK